MTELIAVVFCALMLAVVSIATWLAVETFNVSKLSLLVPIVFFVLFLTPLSIVAWILSELFNNYEWPTQSILPQSFLYFC